MMTLYVDLNASQLKLVTTWKMQCNWGPSPMLGSARA